MERPTLEDLEHQTVELRALIDAAVVLRDAAECDNRQAWNGLNLVLVEIEQRAGTLFENILRAKAGQTAEAAYARGWFDAHATMHAELAKVDAELRAGEDRFEAQPVEGVDSHLVP